MRIPRIRIDPDCADWSERALVAEARLKAMAEARQRDRQHLLRCGKLIRHWISMYRFVDNHSHWQVKALDYERQKRDEAEAKGRRDRQRLRRVLAIGREYASIILNLRVRLFDARHWAAAWKAAAKRARKVKRHWMKRFSEVEAERDGLKNELWHAVDTMGGERDKLRRRLAIAENHKQVVNQECRGLVAKRDALRGKLEEAREILATEKLPLSAGAHLKLAAVLREEE